MPNTSIEACSYIRVATSGEARPLSALALRSKAYWGYDDAFMLACRSELTLTAEDLESGLTFVLEQGQRVLGFHAIEPLDETRAELTFLFVEPAEIGKGHGSTLIAHAKDEARERGFQELLVQGDPHAAHFYEAAGARRVGERASASIPGRSLPLFLIPLGPQ